MARRKRQKEAAISFAESVKKKNDELEKKVNSLDDSYIEEVAQKADIQEVNLKRELAVAHQNQDFNKVAEVQAALADNAATKQRITLLKQKTKNRRSRGSCKCSTRVFSTAATSSSCSKSS